MTITRVLDWESRHDPESRNYAIRALPRLASKSLTRPRNKDWRPGFTLNQFNEGACVGFGCTGEALATPVAVDLKRVARASAFFRPEEVADIGNEANLGPAMGNTFARSLYHRAQQIDEWAGEDYSGTSVNAGMKALRELGLAREWRWCFGIQDIRDALMAIGPVVIGIPWLEGMYEAPGGILTPTGPEVGGHCGLVYGYRLPGVIFPDEAAYHFRNSWGNEWGNDGSAWIRESDLVKLLAQWGEAAVVTRRSYGRNV